MTQAGIALALTLALATACALDDRSPQVARDAGSLCNGPRVRNPNISDFSAAFAGTDQSGHSDIQFSSDAFSNDPIGGSSFVFAAAGLSSATLSLVPSGTDQALRVTASPGTPTGDMNAWEIFGFGLGSGQPCLDASAYQGVQFTLAGSLSTCQLTFGVDFSADTDVRTSNGGTCTLGGACYQPTSPPLGSHDTGLVEVPFAAMTGGSPLNNVDPKTITSLQWQINVPLTGDCVVDFTLDDIAFF